jgi:hypothetical protein
MALLSASLRSRLNTPHSSSLSNKTRATHPEPTRHQPRNLLRNQVLRGGPRRPVGVSIVELPFDTVHTVDSSTEPSPSSTTNTDALPIPRAKCPLNPAVSSPRSRDTRSLPWVQ